MPTPDVLHIAAILDAALHSGATNQVVHVHPDTD